MKKEVIATANGIHKGNFTDYLKIREALSKDPVLRQEHMDPIKEWQTWIDLTEEDIRDLTYYLLHELVFNEPLTSISKIIPLVESNDLKVGLTLYMDDECMYATHTNKHDYSPLFISAEDLVNVLAELIEENEMEYAVGYVLHKLAWKLRIVDDLKDKLKK